MNEQKQKLLLEYLISSPDIFSLCVPILKSDYFTPELRNTVDFILKYYNQYNSIPSISQITSETSVTLQTQEITKDKIEYCANEVESFCRRRAIEEAIQDSAKLVLSNGDFGKIENIIKDAVTVSLNRNMGLQYFDNPEKRLQSMLVTQEKISTGYEQFDEKLFGGIARKELMIITANTGGGKSLTMGNLSLNFVLAGLHVLYISLEMSAEILAQRFDSMISGISSAIWKNHINDISQKVKQIGDKSGKLSIVQMLSGTNANQIKAHIREYQLFHGHLPDILVVDYIDIMGTNEYVPMGDVFTKDKYASEQIRNLGVEYNMAVISASQQNRSAIEATHINQSHIAGGISKANTCDIWVSAILNDSMRKEGKISYQFLKTRNSDGVGKIIHLNFNTISLRITDEHDPDDLPPLKKKGNLVSTNDVVTPNDGDLLGIMQI